MRVYSEETYKKNMIFFSSNKNRDSLKKNIVIVLSNFTIKKGKI